MNKTTVILGICAFAIVAIVVAVVVLAPNSKTEVAAMNVKPVEQKNSLDGLLGIVGGILA